MTVAVEPNPYRLQLPENFIAGTILADPPWPLDKPGTFDRRRRIHYARMSIDEIKSIPVHLIAHPDAHLWLWTTNPHLEKALEVVKAWGFEYKTLATWRKTKVGTGWWLRSRTEHLILAARSNVLRHNPGSYTTEIVGEWRGHSVKPKEAYEMIEALSPGPYLELFAKDEIQRPNWLHLSKQLPPSEPFGQIHKRPNAVPDPGDGIVRGVGGLEIHEGEPYTLLVKTLTPVRVTALSQRGRRVRIEISETGEKKSVSIDSLRGADYAS